MQARARDAAASETDRGTVMLNVNIHDVERTNDPEYVLSLIHFEMIDDNIKKFCSLVDDSYKSAFEHAYGGFVSVGGHLLERKSIVDMYSSMVLLFPFVHSVFALVVSTSSTQGKRVGLSQFLSSSQATDMIVYSDDPVDDSSDLDLLDLDDKGGDSDTLTKRQRAILEFFVAKMRFRSQKKIKHWALISPLASYSHGHMANPPSHPLHGAGCCMKTMWSVLNDFFKSSTAARIDVVSNQFTVSIAFDNWQQNSKKIWPTYGSSSNYLRGVALLIKKDKAFMLPVGTLFKSPSSVQFRVLSCKFLDLYAVLISGKEFPCNDAAPNVPTREMLREVDRNESATNVHTREMAREMEIQQVITGSLVWPTIGWDVISLFGVIPAAEQSFFDPIIPPPMNACVHCDASLDNLLFMRRQFYQSGNANSRDITSIEYDKLIKDY